MFFIAKYDKVTKCISIFISLLLWCISIAHFIWISPTLPLLSYATTFLLLAILLVAYCLSIRGYTVINNTIIIHKVIGTKIIALQDITRVTLTQYNDRKVLIKLFGSGGLFGYYGSFRSSKFGILYLYATSLQKGIVLTAPKKRYYLSPILVDSFIKAIQKQSV